MTESLSSFWDSLFGVWGDLGAVFLPCHPILLVGVTSDGPLGPCSLPWTFLIGDGVPVECPGGINESLGGLNHGSCGNCLSWTSKACSASCINSFILALV